MSLIVKLDTKELNKLFGKLEFNTKDLRPALRKIGGVMERASEVAFDRQGPGWKRLKQKTKDAKQKAGLSPKILTGRGDLVAHNTTEITANSVFHGNNLIYARPHNLGSPKQGIPQREFLILDDAVIRKSQIIIRRHLLRDV